MKRTLLLFAASLAIFADAGPADAQTSRTHALAPLAALAEANADARRQPDPAHFSDAAQIYDYAPGALYEVYAAPGFISTIMLEPGEGIVTVAAGDTTRWMVEETTGGDMGNPRALLLLKPTRGDIRTNIVLVTDRRTYSIEAIAVPGQTYSAQIAWRYPGDGNALAGGPSGAENFNFGYRIQTVRGFAPHWRPVRAFDDGRKTYIEFPPELATSEAPPLFITEGGEAALVNFRVSGNRYVIDRLFDAAELRLGAERPVVVRITRDGAAHPPAPHLRQGGHP